MIVPDHISWLNRGWCVALFVVFWCGDIVLLVPIEDPAIEFAMSNTKLEDLA